MLSQGDIYRMTFNITPTAWPAGFTPDVLILSVSAGTSCMAGLTLEIFDGSQSLGLDPSGICGSNLFYGRPPTPNNPQLDFSTIVSGTINGQVDIGLLGTTETFNGLWKYLSAVRLLGAPSTAREAPE